MSRPNRRPFGALATSTARTRTEYLVGPACDRHWRLLSHTLLSLTALVWLSSVTQLHAQSASEVTRVWASVGLGGGVLRSDTDTRNGTTADLKDSLSRSIERDTRRLVESATLVMRPAQSRLTPTQLNQLKKCASPMLGVILGAAIGGTATYVFGYYISTRTHVGPHWAMTPVGTGIGALVGYIACTS